MKQEKINKYRGDLFLTVILFQLTFFFIIKGLVIKCFISIRFLLIYHYNLFINIYEYLKFK